MNTLDRYIAKSYLVNVLALLVILYALILATDYSLNFDEYIRQAAERDVAGGASFLRRATLSLMLLINLWWPRLFQYYNYLLGMVLIGGMGFTLGQMVRHREIVACLAGGIGLHRIARPILIVAAGFVVLQGVNREFVVPRLAELLTREKWDAGTSGIRAESLPLTEDAAGRCYYAKAFDAGSGEMSGVWIRERDEKGLPTRKISAAMATYDAQAEGWRLTEGLAEVREGDSVRFEPVEFVKTELNPTTLKVRRFSSYGNNLSTMELSQLIEKTEAEVDARPDGERRVAEGRLLDRLVRLRVARWTILACTMLAIVVCLPFFLRKIPGDMLARSVMCAPVALAAVLGSTLLSTAAIPGLPPTLSALIPALILLPLAIAAISSIRS
ncbi:MAG: LptF/LptG family permease [Phycisphaerales bacterium]